MSKKRYDLYSRKCDRCGKDYVGRGKQFCSCKCSANIYTTIQERFWSKVNIDDLFSCWKWTGSTFGDNGYGAFAVNGVNFGAHRIAYMLIYGMDSIPENYEICHTCDNKKCVNPAHLFLGSQQDNMNDKVLKQRQVKGELVGISVLTEKQVIEIIQLLKIESISKIARQFDVHGSTIGLIKSEKTWKHIPRD